MAKTKSLADLFVNLLKDMYYAEKQILKTLPTLTKKADSDELRQAFEHHLKETEGQVQRLEQVFALCDLKPSGKTCHAIKGILEEGDEDIKHAKDPDGVAPKVFQSLTNSARLSIMRENWFPDGPSSASPRGRQR